ncbi:uncharacterized protein METZ01_LOCUS415503, partial [marine metagenome]
MDKTDFRTFSETNSSLKSDIKTKVLEKLIEVQVLSWVS